MVFRVPVLKRGGSLVAILNNGEEKVYGRDEKELAARLRVRTHVLRATPVRKLNTNHGLENNLRRS